MIEEENELYINSMNQGIRLSDESSRYRKLFQSDSCYETVNAAYRSSKEAIECFKEATIICPNSVSAWNNYGFSLVYNDGFKKSESKDSEACQCFRKCLQLDAAHINSRKNLINISDEKDIFTLISTKRTTKISAEIYTKRGLQLFHQGRYEDSIALA